MTGPSTEPEERRARRGRAGLRGSIGLLGIVAKRDYLRTVRRRGFVFGTLLLPLGIGFFMTLSGFVSGGGLGIGSPDGPGGPEDFVLLVANESPLDLQPAAPLTPHVQLVSREEGLRRLGAGSAEELYVLPSTYPDDPTLLRIDARAAAQPLGGLQRQGAQQHELALLIQTTLLRDAAVAPDVVQRVVAPFTAIDAQTLSGAPVAADPSIASFLLPFAFTMLFVLSIFITTGYLLQSVTEEKENRVVEIVLSSVPALPLMGGKILGLGAAGLTQVVVWVLTAAIAAPLLGDQLGELSSISISPVTLILAVAYFALGYLAYGAMFSAVGALAPGSREAQQYAGIFGFAAVVPLIFSGLFLADIESPIVTVLALIPLTTPATMLMVLTLAPEPPWLLIVASLTSLALFTIVATVASARVFRATLLLYGVRPSIGRIVGAIFARG